MLELCVQYERGVSGVRSAAGSGVCELSASTV